MLNSFYTENICQKRLLFCFSSPFLPEQAAYLYTFLSFQDGRTPLHIASFQGHLECIKALIKASADINLADKVIIIKFYVNGTNSKCTRDM